MFGASVHGLAYLPVLRRKTGLALWRKGRDSNRLSKILVSHFITNTFPYPDKPSCHLPLQLKPAAQHPHFLQVPETKPLLSAMLGSWSPLHLPARCAGGCEATQRQVGRNQGQTMLKLPLGRLSQHNHRTSSGRSQLQPDPPQLTPAFSAALAKPDPSFCFSPGP